MPGRARLLADRAAGRGPASSVRAPAWSTPSTSREHDIALLAESGSIVVTCPTTEGNLGDGVLPGLRYRDAGVRLAIGTDEQTRIDPFEELREMETLARREGQTRFALLAAADGDLWGQMVANGRASLGLAAGAGGVDRARTSTTRTWPTSPSEDLMLAVATCASAGVVRAGVSPS